MTEAIFTAETLRRREGRSSALPLLILLSSLCLCLSAVCISAQEQPPAPGAPHPVKIPQVVEKKLPNGLTVVVVERKGSPLVAARLMIGVGSSAETLQNAGLANMTADLITKGTKTRDATKIAEDLEFLGADLGTYGGTRQHLDLNERDIRQDRPGNGRDVGHRSQSDIPAKRTRPAQISKV